MMNRRTFASTVFALAALTGTASSSTITFIYESAGSGTLDGVRFGDAAPAHVVITAFGETSGVDVSQIVHTTASITIDGVGAFDFLSPTRTFVANFAGLVGFSRAVAAETDLLHGPENFPAFGNWGMRTSVGPVTGQGEFLQWSIAPSLSTTGGVLMFDSAVSQVTFTAIVPAPAAASLLGAAGSLGLARRRR